MKSLTDEYRSVTTKANNAITACTDLESPCARPMRQGTPPSMRWALTHMIEETARHAGHMDILRGPMVTRPDHIAGRGEEVTRPRLGLSP